nr:diguanylate cyclase [Deltaproteobacteria bacterium]
MKKTESGPGNMKGFIDDLKNELVRAREDKNRTTLLLVELDKEKNANKSSREFNLERVYKRISEILRNNDSLYRIAENRFAAILPVTYEAGGEAAALRLKKLIPERISECLNMPCSLSVGVLSVDPNETTDHKNLLASLEKDLFRDQECRELDYALIKKESEKEQTRHVVILGDKLPELDAVASILSLKDCEVHCISTLERGLNALRGHKKGVLVVAPDISVESRPETYKKIRSDRELHDIYIICLQKNSSMGHVIEPPSGLVDEILPADIGIDQIVRSVSAAFRVMDLKKEISKIPILLDIINFVGCTSHQLNQPLQVIIGKIEILLLNEMGDEDTCSMLKEIRKQALRAADINQKISRLVKHNISTNSKI